MDFDQKKIFRDPQLQEQDPPVSQLWCRSEGRPVNRSKLGKHNYKKDTAIYESTIFVIALYPFSEEGSDRFLPLS